MNLRKNWMEAHDVRLKQWRRVYPGSRLDTRLKVTISPTDHPSVAVGEKRVGFKLLFARMTGLLGYVDDGILYGFGRIRIEGDSALDINGGFCGLTTARVAVQPRSLKTDFLPELFLEFWTEYLDNSVQSERDPVVHAVALLQEYGGVLQVTLFPTAEELAEEDRKLAQI